MLMQEQHKECKRICGETINATD